MILSIFDLEEGFSYYCSAFEQNHIFQIKDKRLQILNGEKWSDYSVIDLRWFYEELPDQRNKCPSCQRSMQTVFNGYLFMGKWYSGLYCKHCHITTEGPDVPKLGISSEQP